MTTTTYHSIDYMVHLHHWRTCKKNLSPHRSARSFLANTNIYIYIYIYLDATFRWIIKCRIYTTIEAITRRFFSIPASDHEWYSGLCKMNFLKYVPACSCENVIMSTGIIGTYYRTSCAKIVIINIIIITIIITTIAAIADYVNTIIFFCSFHVKDEKFRKARSYFVCVQAPY